MLLGDLSHIRGGRTLKNGELKNHLQDKIYPFELATACVDFEEQSTCPLSLLNESFFEATFNFRDEMINIFHSKVEMDKERKSKFWGDALDEIVPCKKYRSHMGLLDRHLNRQIIVCGCWTRHPKWSLNIKRRLLFRSATLSYGDRITICPSGTYKHAIKIDTYPQRPGTGFYDHLPTPPPLFIDQCGSCDVSGMPDDIFRRTLNTWVVMKNISYKISMGRLSRNYLSHLWTANKLRARRIKRYIRDEIKKPKCNIITVQRAYDGYSLLKQRWPRLPTLRVTSQLRDILNTSTERKGKVWDGDLEDLPDVTTLTKSKLKEILRFYQIRQVEPDITLKGNKAETMHRAQALIQRYGVLFQEN